MKSPKIVIVGHVCIDHNKTENAEYTGWGSSVFYIAECLRTVYRLEPVIITRYGPDMLKYAPPVRLIPSRPDQSKTLRYENDTSVQPRIWRCHNTAFAGEPRLDDEAIETLRTADIIIVATLLPNYSALYVRRLLEYARPTALKVLCPQGYLRHVTADGLVVPRDFGEALDLVPLFDLVVYSEEDSPKAFAMAQDWARVMAGHIIVTQGDKGASIVSKNGTQLVPTASIPASEIIDSVGCGDTFDAAVTYHFYESHNMPEAVKSANQAAAHKLRSTPLRK